jgi:hypothetical protein
MKSYLMLLVLLFTGLPALADDSIIAYVKTVSGTAMVKHDGVASNAQPGSPVRVNDVLTTGANSSLGITFKDNTVMSFGPNTEMKVDEYLYSPGKDDLKLSTNIFKGTMEYISGVIAKLKPQSVAVKTPSGIIGVRGTRFLVKVDDLSASAETPVTGKGE